MKNWLKKTDHRCLLFFLGIGAFLRLFGLSLHDAYTDEVLLGFRSIGLIDYIAAVHQTTPWEWLGSVPDWARLSFHDHPLFFFIVQHLSLQIFGETLFALRIVPALSGIGVIFLLWLLGKELFSTRVGLIAAALASVSSYAVWISRVGLQDGFVLFLVLLATLFWIRKQWIWFGVVMALGFFTKYTAGAIMPILLLYSFLHKDTFYKQKRFWIGVGVSLLGLLPSFIYNINLFKLAGHFDLQLSSLFGQETPRWEVKLGRQQAGSLLHRAKAFFTVLYYANSQWLNVLFGLSFLGGAWVFTKKQDRNLLFILLAIVLVYLELLVLGSTLRFGVFVLPWLVLLLAFTVDQLMGKKKIVVAGVLGLLLAFEIAFSAHSFLTLHKKGEQFVHFAGTTIETQHYGYRELQLFIDEFLQNRRPAFTGIAEHEFLTQLHEASIADAEDAGHEAMNLMIVYDQRMDQLAKLWTLDRHGLYRGWPVISDARFAQTAGDAGVDYFRDLGVERFMYIRLPSEDALLSVEGDEKQIESAKGEHAFTVVYF